MNTNNKTVNTNTTQISTNTNKQSMFVFFKNISKFFLKKNFSDLKIDYVIPQKKKGGRWLTISRHVHVARG